MLLGGIPRNPLVLGDFADNPVQDRNDERADERGGKARDVEAVDDARHEPEERRIDHQRKEAEGDDIERQRQKRHDRLHDEVEEYQTRGDDDGRRDAGDRDARDEVREGEDGKSGDEPAKEDHIRTTRRLLL